MLITLCILHLQMGHFVYAAKAFDVLERLDPDPEYWEGKRGACIGHNSDPFVCIHMLCFILVTWVDVYFILCTVTTEPCIRPLCHIRIHNTCLTSHYIILYIQACSSS